MEGSRRAILLMVLRGNDITFCISISSRVEARGVVAQVAFFLGQKKDGENLRDRS